MNSTRRGFLGWILGLFAAPTVAKKEASIPWPPPVGKAQLRPIVFFDAARQGGKIHSDLRSRVKFMGMEILTDPRIPKNEILAFNPADFGIPSAKIHNLRSRVCG